MLGALNTITPFSIDMYLPAFPKIAVDLHTNIQNVALSVSAYFLGFALGQILYGPLLDRFGRKRPLYIGLSLYIVATIICSTSIFNKCIIDNKIYPGFKWMCWLQLQQWQWCVIFFRLKKAHL